MAFTVELPDPEVIIAIPTNGNLSIQVAIGMAYMREYTINAGYPTMFMWSDRGDVATARRHLVDQALAAGAKYIFWLDSDILAPVDTIVRLIQHNVPVVGGLYHSRAWPHEPFAFVKSPTELEPNGSPMAQHITEWNEEGLTPVVAMGQGCVLVETDVYRAMSNKFGDDYWYVFSPLPVGEDIWFFRRLDLMGVPVALDASIKCEHEAKTSVSTESYLNAKKVMENEP